MAISEIKEENAPEKIKIKSEEKAKSEDFERKFYSSVLAGLLCAVAAFLKHFLRNNFGLWPQNETSDILLAGTLNGLIIYLSFSLLGKKDKK